ncbi:hypothetical protein MAR_001738 [Mya arenaria]|uniref:Uncharacterized protein n=1 Tax=Mya arenaria TaxID=6604 RepID=A0ABY7FCM8_MYAAR|nr:hypothetical protein MAR_001738 [Mya arenaria]
MNMMCVTSLIILAAVCGINAQIATYGDEEGSGVPYWCPRGSPRIFCKANPCTVNRCPAYPRAICRNDNPCEPACEGHFYIDGRRLTDDQCQEIATYGDEGGSGVPSWCPRGSPLVRCFVNPCTVNRCPAYPGAICRNDNPCEPACQGHFYIDGRQLTDDQCQAWCPPGSPGVFCFVNPCTVNTNDNPCNPACEGNFYLRRRKLTDAECQGGPQNTY